MNDGYIDTSLISIRIINKNVAKEMIIKNHYTHKWSLCQVAYGVFIKTDSKNDFVETDGDRLIGCCIFGQPVGRSAAASICPLIKIDEIWELTRLWIEDLPNCKNLESYTITQCIKLIKRDFPHIKCILSYADGRQNHCGKIYQATNFLYQGNSNLALMPNFSVSLTGPPYEWIHSRTVSSKWGSHNVEHLKNAIGHTFYRMKESAKHRYIMFISDKISNKRFIKNLKHPILPYPKENSHVDEIEEVVVDEIPNNNPFFDNK